MDWTDWRDLDGASRADGAAVAFEIGTTDGDGADLFQGLIVTAPLGLAEVCRDEGFVWGRHTIVVDTFRQGETREAVLNFVEDYLGRASGSIDERFAHAAQLAKWEHEDIDVLFDLGARNNRRRREGVDVLSDDSLKPITKARLVELSSPDCNLDIGPTDHSDFSTRIHARISAVGSDDNAVYEILLCTPNRVAAIRDLRQISLFDGFAFVDRFDLAKLEQEVREVCADLLGYTSEEAIAKFSRYARRLKWDSPVES